MKGRLLIIEDDPDLGPVLELEFVDYGYEVQWVQSCNAGLEALRQHAVDLILLDQHLPDGTGYDLLGQIKAAEPQMPIIMMTAIHDLELAIESLKAGASDFIHKPFKSEELLRVTDKAIESRRMQRKLSILQEETRPPVSNSEFIGCSQAMLEVSKRIALCAQSHANVLITGESGTGKEIVAKLIHHHSGLKGPFVAVNAAAIVDTLLESELFGHEKGAFTGANARKLGRFELAQDGTIFLDEIGDLAQPLQAKILRVLQEGTFDRVGGTQTISTNARVITATHRDLHGEVSEGRFREDLLYRLNVIHIHIPPLRERRDDVPLLVGALMDRIAPKVHRPPLRVSDAAMKALVSYDWPGNVREMENLLTQAIVNARDGWLTPELLPLQNRTVIVANAPGDSGPLLSLDEIEAQHIQRVLQHTQGHKGQSCEILAISRPALDRKIKKYQLILPSR